MRPSARVLPGRAVHPSILKRVVPAIRADLVSLDATKGDGSSASLMTEQVLFDIARIEELVKRTDC